MSIRTIKEIEAPQQDLYLRFPFTSSVGLTPNMSIPMYKSDQCQYGGRGSGGKPDLGLDFLFLFIFKWKLYFQLSVSFFIID